MCRKHRIERGSKLALVTGASTGIGRQYTEQLAEIGYNLIIVSRTESTLQEVAHEIEDKHSIKVIIKPMDLAVEGAAEELFNWCKSEGHVVDVLINNAGMFSFCDMINTPVERVKRTITLHDITYTVLCQLFGYDMAERGGGYILNMSSFSVAFAKEVREKNVWVTAVCPAGIATDLYGLTKKWQGIGLKLHALSTPAFCARRGLNSLWRKRKCIVPDWWCKAFIPICGALPRFALNWLRNFTMKWQK